MEKYPYLFFGSPPIGPVALEVLRLAKYEPSAVITETKMPLEEQLGIVEQYKPTFILVVGYGAILKQAVLDTVAGQALNIHPSLLPKYRGPAPVVNTILDGETETGVTLMEMDKKMDHGPIIAQEVHRLRGDELPEELYRVLTTKGTNLFLENYEAYVKEEIDLIPQMHDEATFTHFLKKEDGLLDLSKPSTALERQIRAYHLWPRSWIMFQGKQLIVEKAHLEQGKLRFDLVQPAGKKIMDLAAFCAGQRLKPEQFYSQLGIS